MSPLLRLLAPTLALAFMLGCSSKDERAPAPPACVGSGCVGGGTTVGGGGVPDGAVADAANEAGDSGPAEVGAETSGDTGRDVADFLDVGTFD